MSSGIDRHLIAAINLFGLTLGVIGGLYLAYDLLGSRHGLLRTMTRVLMYGILFGFGYGLSLSPLFGLIVGTGFGLILGIELNKVDIHAANPPPATQPNGKRNVLLFGALRGLTLGLAAVLVYDPLFGLIFGILAAIGLVIVYSWSFSPTETFVPDQRPRLHRVEIVAAIVRGITTGTAGAIAGALINRDQITILFGVKVGLIVAVVSGLMSLVVPLIEWRVDALENRQMGVLGIALILVGFILQSVEAWLILFDITIR